MTKQLRLDVRVRNNRLIRAREELGLTQAEAARRIGIGQGVLGKLENLAYVKDARSAPWSEEKKKWSKSARLIAAFYGLSPEYLWSEDIKQVRKTAMRLELSAKEAKVLSGEEVFMTKQLSNRIETAFTLMPPIERKILEGRKGESAKTLKDAGAEYGLSATRANQIEQRALGRIRTLLDADEAIVTHPRGLTKRRCLCCRREFKTMRHNVLCSRACISAIMRSTKHALKHLALAEATLWVWLDDEKREWIEP